jgi:hypothetical protein
VAAGAALLQTIAVVPAVVQQTTFVVIHLVLPNSAPKQENKCIINKVIPTNFSRYIRRVTFLISLEERSGSKESMKRPGLRKASFLSCFWVTSCKLNVKLI